MSSEIARKHTDSMPQDDESGLDKAVQEMCWQGVAKRGAVFGSAMRIPRF